MWPVAVLLRGLALDALIEDLFQRLRVNSGWWLVTASVID
jgi:hypothetical protein